MIFLDLGPNFSACNESKCEVPEIETDVASDLTVGYRQLSNALFDINGKFLTEYTSGQWTFPNFFKFNHIGY
jgi:hypothetical protein